MICKTLKLKFPSVISNKIMVIKAVRILSGLGLKEAKDIVDWGGEVTIHAKVEGAQSLDSGEWVPAEVRLTNALNDLSAQGVSVVLGQDLTVTTTNTFVTKVRQLIAEAVLAGEDEVAGTLLDAIKRLR